MRYPLHWLRSFVNPDLDDEALCRRLTLSGLEVEERIAFGNDSPLIVVVEVVSVSPHPSADKLKICQVRASRNTNDPLLSIVCGAPNVVPGMKAPLAKIGAVVQGKTITAAVLRGVDSHGMLCSADELGLGDIGEGGIKTVGLLALPDSAPVGEILCQAFPTADTLLTIKLTPNRGDCLSMMGLAREISALTGAPITLPATHPINETHHDTINVVRSAPQSCPRYAGRLIHGINPLASTPLAMRLRLVQCGERPISALVDITNYLMLEYGQPLHAFDRAHIRGTINVRCAQPQESLTLLNGETINLTPERLVIADDNRVLALAGVMGGADSAISATTQSVFFEAAHFSPTAVQGVTRIYGLSSQAAYRFERGVDPTLPRLAIDRATALTLSIAGGTAGPLTLSEEPIPERTINFRLAKARSLMGYPYTADQAMNTLHALGFTVKNLGEDTLSVTVPPHRSDVHLEVDLIEEVARLIGYDAIEENLPPMSPTNHERQNTSSQQVFALMNRLAQMGYSETQHFGFISKAAEERFSATAQGIPPAIKLANPIADHLDVLRSQLIGSLVEHCAAQMNSQAKSLRTFEWARVFRWQEASEVTAINPEDAHHHPHHVERAGGRYEQPYHLAMLVWGTAHPPQWGIPSRFADFYDLKGDYETLIGQALNALPQKQSGKNPSWHLCALDELNRPLSLHPSRCAQINVNGQAVGVMGELHPQMAQHYRLSPAPLLLEIIGEPLLNTIEPQFVGINRLPMVERDVSVWVDVPINADDLYREIALLSIECLQRVTVFDVYTPKKERADKKSMSLRFWLQHPHKTLEEADIQAVMNAIVARLHDKLAATLRRD